MLLHNAQHFVRCYFHIEATEEIIEVEKELHQMNRLEELKKRLLDLEETHRLKIMSLMGMHQS